MKRLIPVLFAIILLLSCKKEEEKTTYQIINNMEYDPQTIEYLDGTLWEVVVYCYIGSDIIRQDNIEKVLPAGGKSEMIEVEPNYEKVKVSFKLLPPQSPNYDLSANHRLYVVAYTILEKEKNNIITISGSTQVGSSLTSANTKLNIGKTHEDLQILLQ